MSEQFISPNVLHWDVIESYGDHDTYGIYLVAGQPYNFDVYGYSGSSGYVGDPTLTLYDYYDSGHFFPLASNDDRLIGAYPLDSHITYTPGYTGWYELDVGAFLNAHTGVYLLGT